MAGLSFVEPRYLLLLLLLVPIWLVALLGHALQRDHGRQPASLVRRWSGLLLRTTVLAALVLGLAGTQIVRAATEMTTVFVLDSSDSVSPSARAQGERYIADALAAMPDGDRAAVVVFGADALVERPPSPDPRVARLRLTPDASATDIGGALRLALATLPAGEERRVILLSDGAETNPGALEVAAEARAAGIPIETVSLISPPAVEDVVVEALEVPASARDGQTVRLVVQARSGRATPARLRLLRDRQLILDTTVDLRSGVTRLPVTAEAPRGFHTWEARLEAPEDGSGTNNVAFGFTDVRGPPRILLIEGAPGRAANLHAALTSARLDAVVAEPGAAPRSLAALDPFDAVVLVDVPLRSLPPETVDALPPYVRELGHGLLMVGGEDSYAAGGYLDTPVESVLPVSMRTRGADIRPDIAIVFVIDRSGSMDGQKLDLAKEGVAQAYSTLEDQDQVGVIAFDSAADWIVDLQGKPPSEQFLAAIGRVSIGGGTDLRPGLESAAEALEGTEAKIKHVVLLTDGQADRNYDDVVERLKRGGITLSAVGVGDGYDPHLRDIAPIAGGRFYEALDFGDIPRLFFDETLRIARRGIVETTFTPSVSAPFGAAATAVRDLREVPPLYGYNAVTARDTAQVILAGPGGDPILADWQAGLGRAAAWTSDMKGQWARDWVTSPFFAPFAAQLVDSLVRPPLVEGFEANAGVAGSSLAVDLRVDGSVETGPLRTAGRLLAPDGTVIDVPMVEREAGRYRGAIPLPEVGVYRVQVVATAPDGTSRVVATSGAVVPPSVEYLRREGNPGLLRALAEATGGRYDFPADAAFARPPVPARRSAPITWPLLWLAALLWPLDIAVRRVLLPAGLLAGAAQRLRRAVGYKEPMRARANPALRRAEAIARARRAANTTNGGTAGASSASKEQRMEPGAGAPAPIGPAGARPTWRHARRTLPERPSDRKRDP